MRRELKVQDVNASVKVYGYPNLMRRELKVLQAGRWLAELGERGNLMRRELKACRRRGGEGPTSRPESHEERIESSSDFFYFYLYHIESHEERIESPSGRRRWRAHVLRIS